MSEKPNKPWFTWWVKPRQTIQQIIDYDASYLAVPLILASGAFNTLNRASMRSLGDDYDLLTIILISLIAGPIGGLIGWLIFGALLKLTGDWIGGKGDGEAIKAALAWANIPVLFAGALWFIELPLYGHELFTTETPRIEASIPLSISLIGFAVIEFIIGVWALVLYLRALGQVQGFSAWKALLNSLLAAMIVAVPILAITLFFIWASG